MLLLCICDGIVYTEAAGPSLRERTWVLESENLGLDPDSTT